jgi:plastocyanin
VHATVGGEIYPPAACPRATVYAAPGIRRPAVMVTETRCASGDERQHSSLDSGKGHGQVMAVTYCLAVAVTIAVIWLWVNGVAHGEPLPVIRIELKEYAFSPARVSIPVGKPVVLRVINRGRTTHMVTSPYLASLDLEVEGAEMEVDAPKGIKCMKLRPGKTAEIKFTPAARGTFEFVFVCEMKEAGRPHRELGMPGELVVE